MKKFIIITIIILISIFAISQDVFVPPVERQKIKRVIEGMDFDPIGDWDFTGTVTGAGGDGGAGAILPTYVTQTPNDSLPYEFALSSLAAGLLRGNGLGGVAIPTIGLPLKDVTGTISIGGLAAYGNAQQAMRVNGATDGLEWADWPAEGLSGNVVIVDAGESIQTAINNITDEADDKRYIVLLTPGRHTITSTITMAQYIGLMGWDKNSTELYCNTDVTMITLADDIIIYNLTITRPLAMATAADNIMVAAAGGNTDVIVKKCGINFNATDDDVRALSFIDPIVRNFKLVDSEIVNTNGSIFGIGLGLGDPGSPSRFCLIRDNVFVNHHRGIYAYNVVYDWIKIMNNFFKTCDFGIYVRGTAAVTYYVRTEGNWCVSVTNPYYTVPNNGLTQIDWYSNYDIGSFASGGAGTANIMRYNSYSVDSPLNYSSDTYDIGGLSAYGTLGQVMKTAAGLTTLEWGDICDPADSLSKWTTFTQLADTSTALRAAIGAGGADKLRGTAEGDSNVIYVQPGTNQISDAITGITDESASNTYIIVLRAGRHAITSTITMAQYISLKGEGITSTELYTASALDPMITLNNNLTISDMTIYHSTPTGNDQAIMMHNNNVGINITLKGLLLKHNNTTHDARILDYAGYDMNNFIIENCIFYGDDTSSPTGMAVYTNGSTVKPVFIKNCLFENFTMAIRNQLANDVVNGFVIQNCTFYNIVQHSVYFYHSSGGASYMNTSGNTFINTANDFCAAGAGAGAITWTTDNETPKWIVNNDIENLVRTDMVLADEVTISSNAIDIHQKSHTVDTQGDAVLDSLYTINGATANTEMLLILRTVADARDVFLDNGGGNLQLGVDITLNDTSDRVVLHWDGSNWCLLSHSDN